MKINIHAGHNAPGKKACGAVGYIDESKEARRVKELVKAKLGHTVYDCTINDGKNQSDVLDKIVSKCNANKVDLDISIHFNACWQDKGDGKTKGVEVLVYNKKGRAVKYAEAIAKELSSGLGIKNRGVKENKSLYYLRKTNAPALLIEVCFVDDADDVQHYDVNKAAEAIVKAITYVNK